MQAILNAIGERDHWCVEFGAWDGQRFSNTRNLIESYFYNAVLIEGDAERFAALKKFYPANHNVTFRDNSVHELPKDLSQITYFFQGFDGHLFCARKTALAVARIGL